jgi:hypothetical protein
VFVVDAVDIHTVVIGIRAFSLFRLRSALIANEFTGIAGGEGFDLLRVGQKRVLTGEDLFDPVGQVLPFFLWEREICSQIEEHPLSGAPLCSDRFDELEGMVFLLGFSISMGCFSDEHGRIVLVAGRSVKQLFNNFGTTNVTENVTH